MTEDQFSAMLAIIIPPIIEKITQNSNVDDDKAISRFYQSKLYKELSDENSNSGYLAMIFPVCLHGALPTFQRSERRRSCKAL